MLQNSTKTLAFDDASATSRAANLGEEETFQSILLSWGPQLESWARRVPLRFALGFVTVLFAVVIWAMPPAFQTNDDAVMCMIVSGQGVTLAPDEHLVFTNVVVGKILKYLYTRYPGMLWYGWYLVATQWVTTVAILYCFLRPHYTRLRLWGFAVYFLTLGIYFLVNLQFTSTANMAGIAGGLLLLQVVNHAQQTRREQFSHLAAACLLLVWGGLIRGDAFMLAGMLVAPTLAVAYCLGSVTKRMALSTCFSLLLAAGAMFAADRYHQACYSDPAWQAFYEYNPLRVKFNDEQWVKYTRESKHVFDQVGWNKNDYEMIINWYFDDPLFDKDRLSAILSSHPWMLERNLTETFRQTLQEMGHHRTLRSILFLLPAMCMFLDWRNRRAWPFIVAALSALGLLLAVVLFKKAPPERVYMPVLAFPWLVLLSSMTPCWRVGEVRRRTFPRIFYATLRAWQVRNWTWWKPCWRQNLSLRVISFFLVLGLTTNVSKHLRIGRAHGKEAIEYQKMLADFRPELDQPQRLVVAFGGDFPFEHQNALFKGNNYSGLHFYCIGWPQRTPFAERMKKHYSISSIGQALAEKHDILVIVNSGAYGRIMEYLADHYNSELRIVNLKAYSRSNLSIIEPNVSTTAFDLWDSPILLANPHLEPSGSWK